MTFPFTPLRMFGYNVIEVDPPTRFDLYSAKGAEKSAASHYDLMDWNDLAAMPVGHLARANAILLLWACAPTLRQSFWLMEQWGARYKTELIWRKVTKNGKPRMGPGYRARTLHECVLLGVFGDGPQIHTPFPSLFDGVAREHSRKPDEFYELVVRHTLGLDRCALFTRETRPGFDCWGAEHGKFDPALQEA
jgi:N6-adenosine-specific RNA methylase IME4